VDNIAAVTVPTLIVHPTADTEIRTHQAEAIRDASGAADTTYVPLIGATHYLTGRRREVAGLAVEWMAARGL